MNIVFFSRFFYPHIGGVEKHVLNISRLLAKKHTVTVLTERHDTSLPLVDSHQGIAIHRIPIKNVDREKKYDIWNYLFDHRDILTSADVIHIHDVFYWYFPFRFMYPMKKVYTTFHGYEGNDLPTRKAKLSHRTAEILSYGNICIGDYLSKWYGTRPTVVSYGAIEPYKGLKIKNKQQTLSKRKAIEILYIGRLEKEAGIMEYLRLCKRLKQEGYKFSLTVVGDGAQRNQATQYVQKHKLPVIFKGFIREVEKYVPKVHVIFTSRYLGTLEAMLYKKPVLCIYNNEIKKDCFEMAPFKDFIYLASNTAELFTTFEEIVSDEKNRNQKVKKAYDFVKDETWEKMAGTYERLWKIA